MKIFNVSLRVVITQIAEIPDNPPEPPPPEKPYDPLRDDPVKAQEGMINKFMDRAMALAAPVRGMPYASESDGASMAKNVRVQAETFEELQEILKKFSDAAGTLRACPEELLKAAVPTAPTPGWG